MRILVEGSPAKLKNFVKPVVDEDVNPSTHYGSINIHNKKIQLSPNGPFTWFLGTRGNLDTEKLQQRRNCNNKSLNFGGGQLQQCTHTNSTALLGKHQGEYLLHQTSNSSDQKKVRLLLISLGGLFSSFKLQQNHRSYQSAMATQGFPSAPTHSLQASMKISVSHTVGVLYRKGPKALGTPASSRLQE